MDFPANWQSPVKVAPGQTQSGVDPLSVLPSRADLYQVRLDMQRALQKGGIKRLTPIKVTSDGVIWDGHHAVRVAAEDGIEIEVLVVNQSVPPSAKSIMDLPVR